MLLIVDFGGHDETATGDLALPSRHNISQLPAVYFMAPNPLDFTHAADAELVTRTFIETIQKWMVFCLGTLTLGLCALMISGIISYRLAVPDNMKRAE